MLLQMRAALATAYKSGAQKTRVLSEDWAETNLYCPACPSDKLRRMPANNKATDFVCQECSSRYELKSSSRRLGGCIPDGDHETMRQTILSGKTPNLFTLQYDLAGFTVQNLSLIPSFAFTLSCLQKRNPLSQAADRHDWVGCNILLRNIPQDVRIPVISDAVVEAPDKVRQKFKRLQPLAKLDVDMRGWTLDVLNVVRKVGKTEFTLPEVYKYEGELQELHPDNKHVTDKIRQQLQKLRDLGFLTFVDSHGTYRLK